MKPKRLCGASWITLPLPTGADRALTLSPAAYGALRYTSPAVPAAQFDALRVSWNAGTPPGTAVEAQARVMVDGNWTSWSSFGRWSPYLEREGAASFKGAVNLLPDSLVLDSKNRHPGPVSASTCIPKTNTPPLPVSLVGVSVRAVDVIPAGGRPINARLHLMPYAVARRALALQPVMDLGYPPGQPDQPLGRRYPARRICPCHARLPQY